MALFSYMQQVQRLINDTNQVLINPADLIAHINYARREVAMRSQCVRILPPISGSVTTITVIDGGTGYTAPVVTVTAPDFPNGTALNPLGAQATAVATVQAGVITNIDVTYGGSGYFQPQITITDPTGVNATAVAETSPTNITQDGQEIYPFSSFDLSTFPGVAEVIAVRSISIIFANYRYSLPVWSFSSYQAYIRQFPLTYQYVPTAAAQFGQGANGSLYLYPIASQPYQMEVDCLCLPQDLQTDQDVDVIPHPWSDAVQFLAAHYCYLQLQNLNSAAYYRKMADEFMVRSRGAANPGRSVNPYGSSR